MTCKRLAVLQTVALIMIAAQSQAHAQKLLNYKCTVKQAYALKGDQLSGHSFTVTLVGQEFVVDRTDGRILGNLFSSSYWTGRQEVLDNASQKGQSFKAMYTSGGRYMHVMFIEILEDLEGRAKPFLLVDGPEMVVTGSCTHLGE